MIPLNVLKQEKESIKDIGNIIDVLKTVSLVQFRQIQARKPSTTEFNKELQLTFNLLDKNELNNNPLLNKSSPKAAGILVATSDEGFLGDLNSSLLKKAIEYKREPNDQIIVLGEKGKRYLKEKNECFLSFPGLKDDIKISETIGMRNYLISEYKKRFNKIIFVYPKFISFTSYKIDHLQLLPFPLLKKETSNGNKYEVSNDPSPGRVLEGLVTLWITYMLNEIFWSTKFTEYSVRAMYLESSNQELLRLKEKSTMEYFKTLHALNDKTIREVSVSKLIMGKKKKTRSQEDEKARRWKNKVI
ncbi:MAG: FoF1 ATP synthase subunit gamma [bacterium]